MGKGQPACPEAGSVQLSESLTSTQSTPTLSLPPPASHRTPTQASGGAQGWKGTTTQSALQGERDNIARRATVLCIEISSFHFTCHAKLCTACYLPCHSSSNPWSAAREFIIYKVCLLKSFVIHLYKYEMWELHHPKDMFNKIKCCVDNSILKQWLWKSAFDAQNNFKKSLWTTDFRKCNPHTNVKCMTAWIFLFNSILNFLCTALNMTVLCWLAMAGQWYPPAPSFPQLIGN